jgi:hypothetical protein
MIIINKFYTFITCILVITQNIHSQKVVSTCGGNFQSQFYNVSWTIGEPLITTLQTTGNVVTQGFHQKNNTDEQQIPLTAGWNIISTYIEPYVNSLPTIFGQLQYLTIVKDDNGNVYLPQYSINNISYLITGKGYQLKTMEADVLIVKGKAVVPEYKILNIPAGWSIIGYLRKNPAPIEQILQSLVPEISIMKNGIGQVYWPQYSVNNIIDMNPGKGYQLKLFTPREFSFPSNYQLINQ